MVCVQPALRHERAAGARPQHSVCAAGGSPALSAEGGRGPSHQEG